MSVQGWITVWALDPVMDVRQSVSQVMEVSPHPLYPSPAGRWELREVAARLSH